LQVTIQQRPILTAIHSQHHAPTRVQPQHLAAPAQHPDTSRIHAFALKKAVHMSHTWQASRVAQHTFDSSPFFIGNQTQLHRRARDHIPNKAPGPSTTAFPFQKKHDHLPQKIVHIHLVCAVEAVQTTQSVTAARWPFLTHTLALMLAAARRRRHRRRWQRVPQQRAAEMAVHRVM